MRFTPEVRMRALVAAARHCCVCRRYKGVNVEVHHIVPESDGGTNAFENAIALCFDCHADAGHYNQFHPRGTKFSPDELSRHRDAWYEIVQSGDTACPTESDKFYCRYLLCKSYEVLSELLQGETSRLPPNRGTPYLIPGLHIV